MTTFDRQDLTDHERRVFDDAFNPSASPRRTRGLILSALVVTTGVVLFTAFGASIVFLAGLTLATLAVSSAEKFVYQRHMEAYESLIRKLVHKMQGSVTDEHPTSTNLKPAAHGSAEFGAGNVREQRTVRPLRNWS